MSAFPVVIRYEDYRLYPSLVAQDVDGNVKVTTQTAPFAVRKVLSHTSVPRTKTSRFLPHRFDIFVHRFGTESSDVLEGYAGKLLWSWRQSPNGQIPSWMQPWFLTESFTVSLEWSLIESKALNKVLESLRGDHGNIAVDVLESRQTLRLIRDLTSVKKQAQLFSKAMLNDTRYSNNKYRRSKYLRDQWMQTRYGIRPLVSSIFDTMGAMLKHHTERRVIVKKQSGKLYQDTRETGTGSYADPSFRGTLWASARVQFICNFRLPTGTWISDFTSLNPLGWIWEKIPLSFVADWVVNIGSTIESWENWFQFYDHFEGGIKTYSALERRTCTYSGSTDAPFSYFPNGTYQDGTYHQHRRGFRHVEFKYMNRYVLSFLPTPSGPRVKVNLDSAKILDICAIISQTLKSVR